MSPPARAMDLPGAALTLLISLLWGGNPVAIKIGLADAPPLRLAWMRFVLGGLLFLAWAGGTRRLAALLPAPGQWRPIVVLGLLVTGQVATLNVGTSLTSASHSAILLNLYAVHTVVLAHFLIPGDRLTPARLGGVLIAYAGIVLLLVREAGAGATSLGGDLLMFVAAFLLGARTVYLARAVQRIDPLTLLISQSVIGCGCFLLGSWLFEPAATRWTARLGAAVAYQGLVVAGFNFAVNLWLLRRYRPSSLAALFLTQPIFGVLAAALITGDPLTADLVAASVAVAIGIGLTAR